MLKRIILLSLLYLYAFSIGAQEQLGLRLSNYGGINSTLLNPAYHSTTPFSWDVNLVEGALHLSNDYAYLENSSLSALLKNPEELEFELARRLPQDVPRKEGLVAVDFFRNKGRHRAYSLASVLGPSFYVQFGGRHRIGLVTRARAMVTARAVAEPLSYYEYLPQAFFEDFPVGPLRAAGAGWTEVGLNYAFQTETAGGSLSFGLTVKALQAYEGIYARNDQLFQLAKIPNDSLRGSPIDFKYGYTTSNINSEELEPQRNGGGMAIDLGVVFTTPGKQDAPYDWKVGFSITDLGRLHFNRNAAEHSVQTDDIQTISTIEYESFQGLDELDEYVRFFSSQSLGDSTASLKESSFGVWLPTALGLQADKALGGPLFIGAAFSQGIPLGDGALQRGSLLALAPRFESRWVSASLPISVYDWEELRLGLALRLAFITIGTDDLGSLARRSDFNGSDFYFAIKVNPFQLFGGGNQRGRRARPGSNKGRVRCYEF